MPDCAEAEVDCSRSTTPSRHIRINPRIAGSPAASKFPDAVELRGTIPIFAAPRIEARYRRLDMRCNPPVLW